MSSPCSVTRRPGLLRAGSGAFYLVGGERVSPCAFPSLHSAEYQISAGSLPAPPSAKSLTRNRRRAACHGRRSIRIIHRPARARRWRRSSARAVHLIPSVATTDSGDRAGLPAEISGALSCPGRSRPRPARSRWRYRVTMGGGGAGPLWSGDYAH